MIIGIVVSDEYAFSSVEREALYTIMRDAYARTETEIWGENYLRMPQSEYEALIDEGKVMAALMDGKIVGGVTSKNLNQDISTFGLLATHQDFGGLGIGTTLVEAVEEKARVAGAKYMNIEILRPRDFNLPQKDRLRSWYEGMGYAYTHCENFQDRRPVRAKDLKVPSVFDCYQKTIIA